MKKKTHGLTVLLLKEDAQTPEVALKDAAALTKIQVPVGVQSASFFYKRAVNPPSWVKLFKPALGAQLDDLFNSGSAAVLFVSAAERTFVITFGYGRTLLNNDCYEENFGLYVVLNSVDPEKLRSVDAQSLDAVPVQVRSQASVPTGIADFGLDIEQDLIYAATGKPKDLTLGKQITGKDAVKVTLQIALDDLPDLLVKLMMQYSAESYKENFAWVDHLAEVRDVSLLTQINQRLTEKISSNDFNRTWLAVPEIIEWVDIEGFKYQKLKTGTLHSDIDWNSYIASLEGNVPCSMEILKKQKVLCIRQSSGQVAYEWSVYRCIYCELELDGATYALTNGKWYRVNVDFLSNLNAAIDDIPNCTIPLPDYVDADEGAYNERVYMTDTAYFVLMDKQNVSYGGGHSKIEFCDLYTNAKHLIHVKRYGGSSVLSHLFAQGLVSARLLLSDGQFRDSVNEKLPLTHKIEAADVKPVPSSYEVVYAIVSNNPARFELPLFSKINLRNCYKQLQMFGMKVSLTVIHAPSVEGEPAA